MKLFCFSLFTFFFSGIVQPAFAQANASDDMMSGLSVIIIFAIFAFVWFAIKGADVNNGDNIGKLLTAIFSAVTPQKSHSSRKSQAVEIAETPVPPQAFSNAAPLQGIVLKLKRRERAGALGKMIFTLDARIDVSAENRSLIEKYKLGNRLIYESANREKYREKARQHAENTRDQPGLFASGGAQAWGLAKTLGRIGAATVNASISALSLRITVNSLMKGVHIECKDAAELLEAEEAIVDAGQNLKIEIAALTTFSGQERVIEL